MSESRALLIDVIRIVACALIILGHIANFSRLGGLRIGFDSETNYIHAGNIGVSLFFILSGMSLQYRYPNGVSRLRLFYFRRVMRIYPILLLSLVMAPFIVGFDKIPTNFPVLALTLTGTCAFVGAWGCELVETSWFVGVIMSLYLVYPYLARWLTPRPLLGLSIIFCISAVTWLMFLEVAAISLRFPNFLYWFPPSRVFEFALGIVLGMKGTFQRWEPLFFPMAKSSITYLSNLTFPAFLIHYPLLVLIVPFSKFGGKLFAVAMYLTVTIVLSHVLLVADRVFQARIKHWRPRWVYMD
jgi:peptidoglycan/LPS O-acetylase OafA/YrhL